MNFVQNNTQKIPDISRWSDAIPQFPLLNLRGPWFSSDSQESLGHGPAPCHSIHHRRKLLKFHLASFFELDIAPSLLNCTLALAPPRTGVLHLQSHPLMSQLTRYNGKYPGEHSNVYTFLWMWETCVVCGGFSTLISFAHNQSLMVTPFVKNKLCSNWIDRGTTAVTGKIIQYFRAFSCSQFNSISQFNSERFWAN
jgi:hypothetical protein